MPEFFIKRPVFAWVIAIIVMLAGILSIKELSIEQYPNIAPPSVSINAVYPGASAKEIENSVTQIIEQTLTGIDNLRYFRSRSSDNSSVITLTFEPGTDPDIAQVQTQNKIQAALSQLPLEVQEQGVFVTKSNDGFLLIAGFYSKDGSVSQQELSDILSSTVRDSVARVNGVGDVNVFGEPHAIRIWLDADRLLKYNMTLLDVRQAVKEQNIDVSAGELGALPAVEGQQINAVINVKSKLRTVEQFNDIILKVNSDGSQVRLKDVAVIELGSQGYKRVVRYERKPATGIAVSMASGANALETARLVKQRINEIKPTLPDNVDVVYPYDTTPFVKVSIEEVVRTLIEAVILVFLVMLLFLQNVRATFIPTIAIPIVLLGTFAILNIFGFSINVLTMFAMVLAIGLLVDDAIVVVENVERMMSQENLSPLEATRRSMKQITNALIGIAMVLSSVFVPMAFFSGSAGLIYRQFSITIVSTMILSVFVALILSPTLCASLLRHSKKERRKSRFNFFDSFNKLFDKIRNGYQKIATIFAQKIIRTLILYFAIVFITIYIFLRLPTSFLPNEDQGLMYLMLKTPPGSTSQRTLESVKKIEDYFLEREKDNIKYLFTVTGFSFAGSAQNTAFGFVSLKDWNDRKNESQSVFSIARRAGPAFSKLKDATAFAFFPPPIRELGNASGFDFQLIDRAGLGHKKLSEAKNNLLKMTNADPNLSYVRHDGLNDVAQFKIDIDTEKLKAYAISISDVNQIISSAFGSEYINDFIDNGRIKRVYMQARSEDRMMPSDIDKWYVKNSQGKMVSFSEFINSRWVSGSPKLERFNGISTVKITGEPAKGVGTGDAMDLIEKYVKKLPKGFDIEWSGISYEEKLSGSQTPALYALSVLIVFLSLAALYESWIVPFAVIFTVPLGIFGASLATKLFGLNNDIYFQVALLTTVGLTAKNSILIVEFAKKLYDDGQDLFDATLTAAKIRFRPIIMTSFAFILGVTPLAISSGAGSSAQNAIGIAVIGGMLSATLISIIFVPAFYILIQSLAKKTKSNSGSEDK